MVYYHIDNSQRYLQSIGFNDVQNQQIECDSHAYNGEDQSSYIPSTNQIVFGEGGVDDAEDTDVILHEYGHAIQYYIIPNFPTSWEAIALDEGFSDYWAGSYSTSISTYHNTWIFNWDGHNEFWDGYILNSENTYSDLSYIERDWNRQIWSSTLWDIWNAIGKTNADKIIVESLYNISASASMHDAAMAIIQANDDLSLNYTSTLWNILLDHEMVTESDYLLYLMDLASNNKSLSQSATAQSGQRKIARDASGNYHVVFLSGGEIYYRKYISGTWQDPVRISYDNGNNNYPSIAVGSTNQVMITWQRYNGTNHDVYFSMSTDGGTTWNNDYILASGILSSSPVPVITYNSTSQRKTICFVTNSGLHSKHTTTSVPTSAASWTTTLVTNISDASPTLASSGNSGYNLFAYLSGSSIHYRYQNSDGSWAASSTNISNMVPGASVNNSPTICGLASSGNVYLAWTRYDYSTGYPTNPRTFYTKNTSANGGWPYQYWGVTSGNQYSPTITALATNKIDLFYTTDSYLLMYTRNNSTTWSSPISKGTGNFDRYPSVSIGSTTANYIWTSGLYSPHSINIGNPALSKESEPGFDNYSRSIAIMNNPEEYLEIVLSKMFFKMKDGSIQRIDFLPADLEELKTKENFDLTTSNAWDLMKGIKDLTIPVGADELVFDYTVRGENIDKVLEGNLNQIDLSLGLNIPVKGEKAEKTKSIIVNSGKITETKLQEIISLSSLAAERGFDKVDLGLKVKGIVPKSTAFASLGHIFNYTNIAAANEIQANKADNADGIITEELATQNYPNPFNPTTLIRFTIKNSGKVTLKVFDVLGREVAELLNTYHEAGSYEIPFDGSNLPSGVYFYNLTANGKSLTKKMVLLK